MKNLVIIKIISLISLCFILQCTSNPNDSSSKKSEVSIVKKHSSDSSGEKTNIKGKKGGSITLEVDMDKVFVTDEVKIKRDSLIRITFKNPFDDKRSKNEARADIANGKMYIKTFCGPLITEEIMEKQRKLSKLTEKYGFQYMYVISCMFWSNNDYNKVVRDHLTQRNGEGWWEKFLAEKARLENNDEHEVLYEL